MSNYNKGGRGKKAPYQTVHYRIPEPMKSTVQTLAEHYRQLANTKSIDEANKMLEQVQDIITNEQLENKKPDTKFSELDLDQVVKLLQEALKLKANTGGLIKNKVREVLNILKAHESV
jgi:NifU-like protein involved in Fe-S cluster formation